MEQGVFLFIYIYSQLGTQTVSHLVSSPLKEGFFAVVLGSLPSLREVLTRPRGLAVQLCVYMVAESWPSLSWGRLQQIYIYIYINKCLYIV